jgi:hypothetical protein
MTLKLSCDPSKIVVNGFGPVLADAYIPPPGVYRYWLTRKWHGALPSCCYVMLNPSTANATINDATIYKCMILARDWGFGSIAVVNLFAWRSRNPSELRRVALGDEWTAPGDPIGTFNDRYLRQVAASADSTVCAWGSHPFATERAAQVTKMLHNTVRLSNGERILHCLGTNNDGSPKHPLYLRYGTPRVPFTGKAAR